MLACNKLVRIHCKVGSASVRLVSETRGKCQDIVARFEDDGIPYAMNSPLCCTNSTITVRQYRSIEDREIGKQFVPLWRELADQLKVLFPDGDDEGVFFLPALDARSQILSIKDSRNGIGKLVFKFAPLGSGQTLLLLHLICLLLAFRLRCCNGFSLKLTGLMCDGRTLASPLFRRIAGRGVFFFFVLFRLFLRLVAFWFAVWICMNHHITLGRMSWWMWASMRSSILPSLFSSVASLQPIYIGAGDSVSEGCWSHMFYDIPVQRCHMPPCRTHVLGLACQPF